MNLLTVSLLAALQWYVLPDGSYRQLDDTTSIPGKLRGVVTNEAAAVTWQAQQDALAAAQAAAAASNAAVQAAMPQYVDAWQQIHTNGVIYVDMNGTHILHTRTNGIPVDIPISASPLSNKTYAVTILGGSNLVAEVARISVLKQLKTSPEYTGLTNQLAQYDTHYAALTNLIATADLTKTNKVQDIMTKQRQATDDLHDALVKLVKLVKDLAGNQ